LKLGKKHSQATGAPLPFIFNPLTGRLLEEEEREQAAQQPANRAGLTTSRGGKAAHGARPAPAHMGLDPKRARLEPPTWEERNHTAPAPYRDALQTQGKWGAATNNVYCDPAFDLDGANKASSTLSKSISIMENFDGRPGQIFEAWWPGVWYMLKDQDIMLSEKLTIINSKIQGAAGQAWQSSTERASKSVKNLVNFFMNSPYALGFTAKCPHLKLGAVVQGEHEPILAYHARQAAFYNLVTDTEQQAATFHHNMVHRIRKHIVYTPNSGITVASMLQRASELEPPVHKRQHSEERQTSNKEPRGNTNQSHHPNAGSSRGGYNSSQHGGGAGSSSLTGAPVHGYSAHESSHPTMGRGHRPYQPKGSMWVDATCFACGKQGHATPYAGQQCEYFYQAKAGKLSGWHIGLGSSPLYNGEQHNPNLPTHPIPHTFNKEKCDVAEQTKGHQGWRTGTSNRGVTGELDRPPYKGGRGRGGTWEGKGRGRHR